MVAILPVQNKNFSGDPEELNEVPGADEGIIGRQQHTDLKQMGLLREQCTE